MKLLKSGLIVITSVGLFFLEACSNSNQAANTDASPTVATSESASPGVSLAKTEPSAQSEASQKGGQVVETGSYHLEFVPEKEDKGHHLDFYLLKGEKHEAIPNAKVTAQVQTPDGTQKNLNLAYDPAGKHYTVFLPGTTSGQYQVKVISDINGEKVNGRFTFNQ